jgi:hypothetical protein
MVSGREIKHYVAGDTIEVVLPWKPHDLECGIRKGERFTCLLIDQMGFTAIDRCDCVRNGKITGGYAYDRFDKVCNDSDHG